MILLHSVAPLPNAWIQQYQTIDKRGTTWKTSHEQSWQTWTTQLFATFIQYRQLENETFAGQCDMKFTELQQCNVKAILAEAYKFGSWMAGKMTVSDSILNNTRWRI